ncbi:MAG TPA: hypothetical protein VK582_12530 [Pyrinomonadaceae bacterium]|nr:hypothetical protein [Pyrinomonadaceae bacterium]
MLTDTWRVLTGMDQDVYRPRHLSEGMRQLLLARCDGSSGISDVSVGSINVSGDVYRV